MSGNYCEYKSLLTRAAQLYEKHEAGRPEPLQCLLRPPQRNRRGESSLPVSSCAAGLPEAGGEARENLEDFLQSVAEKDFTQSGVTVERESDHIDILITNTVGQAVVIEKKICAGDQPEQLLCYT